MRVLNLAAAALFAVACTSSSEGKTGTAGSSGQGSAGATGSAGTSSPAGVAGTTGSGGSGNAGTTGAAGTGSPTGGAGSTGSAGTTGAAGATGAAGTTGGAGTTGDGGTGVVDSGQSVLTRNKHETRDGFFIQPTLTKAMAAKMAPDTTFKATFTGNMWASPLYIENGPNNKGAFFAVTTNNNVYALDETTGATLWMKNIGTAAGQTGAGCGSITPIGIISTPVIDSTTRTIYVAGAIGDGNGIQRHEVHALDLENGQEKPGWPVNVSNLKGPNNLAFNTVAQNQRSALSLVNGTLYVAYGGHVGDCNNYRGWVVAINTANPTQTGTWVTGGVGEAIWAAGGMASDGTNIYAVTGNNLPKLATHYDSEEVVRLSGLSQVDRTTGIFFPSNWHFMDQNDLDFGSVSPVFISLGANKYVAATSKDGHIYILNPSNLGGSTPLVDFMVANMVGQNSMLIRSAPASYVSSTGVHIVMNAAGAVCATGSGGIVSVLVSPGSPPKVQSAWCTNGGSASPIATSTDGKNDTIVWLANGGLRGVDGDTGAQIYSGGNCDGVRQWTSPIAVKGRIILGGDNHLCSWSPH